MNEQIDALKAKLAPLDDAWAHFVVSCVAVQCQEKWVALSTLIELRAEDPCLEPFQFNVHGLLVISSCHPAEEFARYLANLSEQRTLVSSTGETVELAIPNPRESSGDLDFCAPNVYRPYYFPASGSTSFSIELRSYPMNSFPVSCEEIENLSSKVRNASHCAGLPQLFSKLGLEPNHLRNTCTSLVVRAAIPILIHQKPSNELEVTLPPRMMARSRVKSFFDGESCESRLGEGSSHATVTIPWPPQVCEGEVHLFFDDYELASSKVKRWSGSNNWRMEVDRYFGAEGPTLDRVLAERKDQNGFETGVARLLSLLGIPAIWYGAKSFGEKPDLAAMVEVQAKWVVVLGECTVQKPSAKFTMLLTRARELRAVLDAQAMVIPAVFTSTEISSADKTQARKDGISLVGREELGTLQAMVARCAPVFEVVNYLEQLRVNLEADFPMGSAAY
jgi:hypothetical protein